MKGTMRKLTILGFLVLTLAVGVLAGAIMFGSDEGAIGPKDVVEAAPPPPPELTAVAYCSDLADENLSEVKFAAAPIAIMKGTPAISFSAGCAVGYELTGCGFVVSPNLAKVWVTDVRGNPNGNDPGQCRVVAHR